VTADDRREFLKLAAMAGGGMAWANLWPALLMAQGPQVEGDVIEIRIEANYRYARWLFEPAGVLVRPGQKVRWTCQKWGGSVTAFHPSIDNHELRIPEKARPFDSGVLVERGAPNSRFEWVFQEEGTYDYYSRRHESIGCAGRIIVGSPGGPAQKPPGYGDAEGRAVMFDSVRRVLAALSPEEIVKQKILPFPLLQEGRTFPAQESHF
jgi:plastocyanin